MIYSFLEFSLETWSAFCPLVLPTSPLSLLDRQHCPELGKIAPCSGSPCSGSLLYSPCPVPLPHRVGVCEPLISPTQWTFQASEITESPSGPTTAPGSLGGLFISLGWSQSRVRLLIPLPLGFDCELGISRIST